MEKPPPPAPCPICSDLIPLIDINSHIDHCLLVAERQTKSSGTVDGLSRDQLRAGEGNRKRSRSPSPPHTSPGGSHGKQLVLGFGKIPAKSSSVPAKTWKLTTAATTPKSSRQV